MLTFQKGSQSQNMVSVHHPGTSSSVVVVVILPESIDRGYFAVVQKFSQEKARLLAAAATSSPSLPPLSTAGYDNNNPNCVINSIWKQDTNEVYYMAPSARRSLVGNPAKPDYRVFAAS